MAKHPIDSLFSRLKGQNTPLQDDVVQDWNAFQTEYGKLLPKPWYKKLGVKLTFYGIVILGVSLIAIDLFTEPYQSVQSQQNSPLQETQLITIDDSHLVGSQKEPIQNNKEEKLPASLTEQNEMVVQHSTSALVSTNSNISSSSPISSNLNMQEEISAPFGYEISEERKLELLSVKGVDPISSNWNMNAGYQEIEKKPIFFGGPESCISFFRQFPSYFFYTKASVDALPYTIQDRSTETTAYTFGLGFDHYFSFRRKKLTGLQIGAGVSASYSVGNNAIQQFIDEVIQFRDSVSLQFKGYVVVVTDSSEVNDQSGIWAATGYTVEEAYDTTMVQVSYLDRTVNEFNEIRYRSWNSQFSIPFIYRFGNRRLQFHVGVRPLVNIQLYNHLSYSFESQTFQTSYSVSPSFHTFLEVGFGSWYRRTYYQMGLQASRTSIGLKLGIGL